MMVSGVRTILLGDDEGDNYFFGMKPCRGVVRNLNGASQQKHNSSINAKDINDLYDNKKRRWHQRKQ
jgi:hypothetical protein